MRRQAKLVLPVENYSNTIMSTHLEAVSRCPTDAHYALVTGYLLSQWSCLADPGSQAEPGLYRDNSVVAASTTEALLLDDEPTVTERANRTHLCTSDACYAAETLCTKCTLHETTSHMHGATQSIRLLEE